MEKEQKAEEYAKQEYDKAKNESRIKMDEVKIEGEPEGDQATLHPVEEDAQAKWGTEEERGCGGIISSALGGVKDVIIDKITQHPNESGEARTGYGLAVNDVGTAVLLVMDDDDETPSSAGAKAN